MTDREIIEDFVSYADNELGLSPATLSAYKSDLLIFAQFIADVGLNVLVADVHTVASYLQTLSRAGYASASVLRRMLSLQTFYGFVVEKGFAKANPVRALDLPQVENKIPDVLSRELMGKLLASVDPADRFALRDTAILEVFYASGVRVSELIGLELEHWFPKLGLLKVHGKGSKDRIVPVHHEAGLALDAYLNGQRPYLAAVHTVAPKAVPRAIFLSRAGRPLTRMAVWQIVRRASDRALIRPIHPHTLRHTMASHLLSGGADLRVIQSILGHEDVTTTQRYTHVDLDHLKKIHKLHPRQ